MDTGFDSFLLRITKRLCKVNNYFLVYENSLVSHLKIGFRQDHKRRGRGQNTPPIGEGQTINNYNIPSRKFVTKITFGFLLWSYIKIFLDLRKLSNYHLQ